MKADAAPAHAQAVRFFGVVEAVDDAKGVGRIVVRRLRQGAVNLQQNEKKEEDMFLVIFIGDYMSASTTP
ncbi:MAG: hypothetical protein M5U34_08350 [Chloroflexi bacterium]|nr:hypothetical protein [Chloroflexota bacterium]